MSDTKRNAMLIGCPQQEGNVLYADWLSDIFCKCRESEEKKKSGETIEIEKTKREIKRISGQSNYLSQLCLTFRHNCNR